MFDSERKLLDDFVDHLASDTTPWGQVRFAREFYYTRGRTDVVALTSDGRVLAFEGKLEKWRQALAQAYRNLCFAHCSYVLLPKQTALAASRFEAEFRRRGVGLCYLENGECVVILDPNSGEPLQPWLCQMASLAASWDGDEPVSP